MDHGSQGIRREDIGIYWIDVIHAIIEDTAKQVSNRTYLVSQQQNIYQLNKLAYEVNNCRYVSLAGL